MYITLTIQNKIGDKSCAILFKITNKIRVAIKREHKTNETH